VLAEVADIDSTFLDQAPHETGLDVHPNRRFIDRE